MSSYRFCRTDDIGLLVAALNRCWAPYFPDEPPVTEASFKRSIRDLQVWCSSCMVAFAGGDPIAVLIGAKRATSTLIHRIAVHPDHVRQGHGRHLLTSLSSKLAILGPPRLVAEVPDSLTAACELFRACGYVQESGLIDYVFDGPSERPGSQPPLGAGRVVIPVTVDDLLANGLLEARPVLCWERSLETLTARKAEVKGLGVATDEGIEAFVIYTGAGEVLTLGSLVDEGGGGLAHVLSIAGRHGPPAFTFAKADPLGPEVKWLGSLGFRPAGECLVFAARAMSG